MANLRNLREYFSASLFAAICDIPIVAFFCLSYRIDGKESGDTKERNPSNTDPWFIIVMSCSIIYTSIFYFMQFKKFMDKRALREAKEHLKEITNVRSCRLNDNSQYETLDDIHNKKSSSSNLCNIISGLLHLIIGSLLCFGLGVRVPRIETSPEILIPLILSFILMLVPSVMIIYPAFRACTLFDNEVTKMQKGLVELSRQAN